MKIEILITAGVLARGCILLCSLNIRSAAIGQIMTLKTRNFNFNAARLLDTKIALYKARHCGMCLVVLCSGMLVFINYRT